MTYNSYYPKTSPDTPRSDDMVGVERQTTAVETRPEPGPTRDLIAAYLRGRGWTHSDEVDWYDAVWCHAKDSSIYTGWHGPMFQALAIEMDKDKAAMGRMTPGWDRYTVSVAR
jgi:hypothetical protein